MYLHARCSYEFVCTYQSIANYFYTASEMNCIVRTYVYTHKSVPLVNLYKRGIVMNAIASRNRFQYRLRSEGIRQCVGVFYIRLDKVTLNVG